MSAVYFDEHAFADEVMARVAAEPTPTVSGAAGTAVREHNLSLLVGVSRTAWHLATARTGVVRRPLRIKSAALLSVMLLTLAMGTTLAAAGAVAVVQQVTHNIQLPAFTGPHRPVATDSASHAGGRSPGGSQSPVNASDHPVTGATDPGEPVASPNGDGDAQGDEPPPTPTRSPGNDGGGKSTHPSPSPTATPTDDGQGHDNGGGPDNGGRPGNDGGGNDGGHNGTHESPSPSPTPSATDGGQGNDNSGGENVGGGNDNGNTHSGNGATDKGGNPGPGNGNSAGRGDNSR